MQTNRKYIATAICMAISMHAMAESTVDSLSKIEAETLVLKAREKQLSVRAQIVSKQGEIAAKQVENTRLAHTASAGDPLVMSIEGVGATIYATLQLDNGATIDAKAGDVLPNGMKILSVTLNEVIAEAPKKRRVRLATNAGVVSGNYATAPMAFPPLPMPQARGGAR
jgi:type IV pilus biogenesis protein PilP